MKENLISLLACPACGGPFNLVGAEADELEIQQATLVCRQCGAEFAVRRGMPHLYIADQAWAPKAQEAAGWVQIHQDLGIYEQGEEAIDLSIPYYPEEPWIGVARSFDMAREYLQLTGRETILDLGAGRGWAAKQFALLGCRVVALDVVADENVGLGRARTIMTHAGTYFERVIGDGENLPFQPDSFDLVFCAATLHHTSHLGRMIGEISKILKPAGRLCAINEPCISILEQESEVLARDAAHELRLGINERRPNIRDYYAALQQNGLAIEQAIPARAHSMDRHALKNWYYDVGAGRPPLRSKPRARSFWRLYNFGKNRLRATWHGVYRQATLPPPVTGRNQTAYHILMWTTGELFLLARKI